jgi:hypothetical protein
MTPGQKTPPPLQKVRLGKNTKRLMLRRRMWRRRAVESTTQLLTWQTGAPGKDEIEEEVIKSLRKVREWFREPRATTVVMAIQRRAVAAYRQQNTGI